MPGIALDQHESMVLPGRAWLEFDAEFVVYHRKPAH